MRVIPIEQQTGLEAMAADGGACNETEGRVPKPVLPLIC